MDLVIEHILMRSLKTRGGSTRVCGMTGKWRVIWLLSMPGCAEIDCAVLELTDVSYSTSEQNKDVTKSRQARNITDPETLLSALVERNPLAASCSSDERHYQCSYRESHKCRKGLRVDRISLTLCQQKELQSTHSKEVTMLSPSMPTRL